MTPTQTLLLLVTLIVLTVLVSTLVIARHYGKRTEPRAAFGSDDDHTVPVVGPTVEPEREPAGRPQRAPRVQQGRELLIRPLSGPSRERYLTAWNGVQSRFDDAPVLALSEADALLTRVLDDRGLPTGDARRAGAGLSVEHARVLDRFRAGQVIEQANTSQRADTEQVRQGMVHFQAVFAELVLDGRGAPEGSHVVASAQQTQGDEATDDQAGRRDHSPHDWR